MRLGSDGDTIAVRMGGKPVKLRLHGIDAPESGQAFGNATKRALSGFLKDKRVRILKTDRDRWGRTVAEVYANGDSAGLAIVKSGMAWHFRKYAPKYKALSAAEASARAAGRGLWVDPGALPPWDFRKRPKP